MRQQMKLQMLVLLFGLFLGIVLFLSGCFLLSADPWKSHVPALLPLLAFAIGCAMWIIASFYLQRHKKLKGPLSSLFFYTLFAGISLAAKETNLNPAFSSLLTVLFLVAVVYYLARLIYLAVLGADVSGNGERKQDSEEAEVKTGAGDQNQA